MPWRGRFSVLLVVAPLGCPEYEPLPDIDTDTGAETIGDDDGDDLAYDGLGLGSIRPARIRDADGSILSPVPRDAVVVGSPDETWEDTLNAGQATVLIGDGMSGLGPPIDRPATYVEDLHSDACGSGQRFAWDLLPERRLGGGLTFFSRRLGGTFDEFENIPIVAAPEAGASSGRAMIWNGCYSCALFPKSNGSDNVQGGRFGGSMAVGVSGTTETLFVGSPTLGDGRVAVIAEQAFRRWDAFLAPNPDFAGSDGMETGVRECQCLFRGRAGNIDCTPWEELIGSFPEEEFGSSLATGDLDCDGADDLAVGAPGAALPMTGPDDIPEAGAVYVYRASDGPFGSTVPTILRQGAFEVGGTPEEGDRFGHVVLFGNFNGARRLTNDRSCYDLVVAIPGEDDGAGEIQVFEGSANGLTYGGPVIQLGDLFDMASDPGDSFGYSMTAGDLNRDGFDDLVIGAPGDGVGGTVSVIPGSSNGLAVEKVTVLRQGGDFSGTDEPGDQFGFAVSWTNLLGSAQVPARGLVVGVPGENDGSGEIRIYRTTDTPPNFGPITLLDLAVFNQGDVLGDLVSGDGFGSVLMHTRAFPDRPW